MENNLRKQFTFSLGTMLKTSIPAFYLILFFLLLGISAGTCTEVFMGMESKKALLSFLAQGWETGFPSGNELVDIFWSSCIQNLSLLLLTAISGLTVVGFPLILLAVAYKGASLGFSSALLMDALGAKGALLSALSLLPANLIILPTLIISAVLAINLSSSVIAAHPGHIKNCLRENTGNYIAFQLALFVFVLAGCLIDAFICPFLQQLVV